MKSIIIISSILLGMLVPAVFSETIQESNRQKTCLNTGWKFHLGDSDKPYYVTDLDDSSWKQISIPHTLKLTSIHLDGCQDDKMQKTFHRDIGWYRKAIQVGNNKKVFLEFEGAHQVTDIWINSQHVGRHSVGGYTPFHFDISSFVKRGQDNQLTLRVDNRVRQDVPPDPGPFDYIKFSGLYRDVYLVETNSVYIPFNWESLDTGIFITTPVVDPVNMNAIIDFKTGVRNETNQTKNITVVTRVINKSGIVILKLKQAESIPARQDRVFKQIGAIEDDLHLWSIEDPYLYRVNTQVLVDGNIVDSLDNRLGIRKFEQDPVRGFVLNNKPIELIGSNRHQHYGYIGDAMPNSLHYKDMYQFKQIGFNVVRTAHYPQDDALLDACDELGILVYEEAPTWIAIPQDPQWYANYESALRTMIRNHRNHPSVVIWGAGINHRGYVPQAVLAAKQEDPTRLTASQSSRWTGWQSSGLSDLFGNMMYGGGIWDRSEPLLAMEGGEGPAVIAEYKRDPLKTGMISWSAHAYYTFHGSNNKTDRTRNGMMTVFRQPKWGGLMWYPSEMYDAPYLYIDGLWKKDITMLTVYSNAVEVQLLVNDQPFMKQKPSADSKYEGLDHPPFHFNIEEFKPGKLTAQGISEGKIVSSQTIRTPQTPSGIKLVMDTEGRKFVADGADILVGYAHVTDKNGTTCKDAQSTITFSVSGPASIVGDAVDIGANPIAAQRGTAPVLIRADIKPGKVTITAKAEGLESDSLTIETIAKKNDMMAVYAGPIYDFEKIRVDLGASDQLVQFDWIAWNGIDNQSTEKYFDDLGGFTASLKPASKDGILRWLGEMNVIGKYGFAYGEGVIAIDPQGLILEFEDLPRGTYKIKTWHHAPSSNTDSMDPNKEKLKQVNIHKLPYAKELSISVAHAGSNVALKTPVTDGKEMQFESVAVPESFFVSDGVNPVTILFKDPQEEKGVWFNAFELSQWHENLLLQGL